MKETNKLEKFPDTRFRNVTIKPSVKGNHAIYKISKALVKPIDEMMVTIKHESKPFNKIYVIKGSDFITDKRLYFTATETKKGVRIKWSGIKKLYVLKVKIKLH